MKPIVLGIGTGGGLSVLVQLAAKTDAVQKSDNAVAKRIAANPGVAGAVAGVLGAVALKYVFKKKEAFIPALLGAAAASLPAIISAAKEMATAPATTSGTGAAVLQARTSGFGQAPAIQLFGPAPASSVQTVGSHQSHAGSRGFNIQAFGAVL